MAAAGSSPGLLLLCLAAVASVAGVLQQARAQPDSIGFISIDCGLPGTGSYVDNTTKLSYVPDAGFIDTGSNHNISAEYITPTLSRRYHNVRSFNGEEGARNCYTLRSIVAGLKYLLRCTFKYGNYDGLSRPPVFDLHVGVNYWTTVNTTSADNVVLVEAIVLVPDSSVQVCLVDTGSGAPFISGLDLRPLKSTLYPQANATRGLALVGRLNFGPTDDMELVRYPDDPHDRIWLPWVDTAAWSSVSTAQRVENLASDNFEAPTKVMQTAVTPRNGSRSSKSIEFSWDSEPRPQDPTPGYIGIMHFSELQIVPAGALREFYINLNGKPWFPEGFTPEYLYSDAVFNSEPRRGVAQYNISITATGNSTLPPIINAVEVYSVIATTNIATDSQDVSAITAIKDMYHVQRNWQGDPCVPKTLAWDGLTCSYAVSSPPRITGLNLSFSGLTGDISSSFSNLKAIQNLDLSHNNLTGSIPDSLSQLSSLTVLDLTSNQLNGTIPSALLKRIQDGSLSLRYGENPRLCSNGNSCQTTKKGKSKLAIYISVGVVLLVVVLVAAVLLLCFILKQIKQGPGKNAVKPQNETPLSHGPPGPGDAYSQGSMQLENRRFSYKELEMITNNFQRVLGRGGFGSVYDGFLEDGTQVAVKLRSDSSNQGVKEFLAEAIVLVPDSSVQVCLVDTGSGTPFISNLDLRPLKSTLYPQANETQGLVLVARLNLGPTDDAELVRYPDDPYDRTWLPWVDTAAWSSLSTAQSVQNLGTDNFEAPTKVMQTAVTPRNGSKSKSIEFNWDSEPRPQDPAPGYVGILHFSELQILPAGALREFYINLNGEQWYPTAFKPDYLYSDAVYNNNPHRGFAQYNISINATANSTLPPIINAVEVFSVMATTTNIATDEQDVSAITAIKAKYHVQKNWQGDPCAPKTLAWDGLTCSYAVSSPPRITGLNLSSSGLTGDISSSFANLKAIQTLDLSHNNLTGSIPDSLSELSSLTVLDLTSNQLNGTIPSALLKRIQDGSLSLRYGNNPSLCSNGNSCQTTKKGKSKLAIYISVGVVLLVVVLVAAVLLLCFILKQIKQGPAKNAVKPQNETPLRLSHGPRGPGDAYSQSSLRLENRRFTYEELEVITSNFQRVLGRGGFGSVYDGFLEDGTQVAVKLRSDSSNQGVKEFLAEAQTLTRIHHKNLVTMIGYCKDGEYMALVYEYMPEGTLQEHIAENDRSRGFLSWRQRLRIAVESAQGLEYLHKGCNPSLIHRDVKAANILLNAKLEAKIADFGLTKAFNRDDTHVSTNTLVGTPGYVDPEYHQTMQPTTKSDVYSFGVVLLELITGRPAILRDPEPTSVIQWARLRLARGNIEGVVDPRMRGDYDVNSVWKAADVALKCTAQASTHRPTMTDVVAQLQECLQLEEARGAGAGDGNGSYYYTGNSSTSDPYSGYNGYAGAGDDQSTDVSQTSNGFEVEHDFGRVPTMSTGPAAR